MNSDEEKGGPWARLADCKARNEDAIKMEFGRGGAGTDCNYLDG